MPTATHNRGDAHDTASRTVPEERGRSTNRPGFPSTTVSTTAVGLFTPLRRWAPRPTTTQSDRSGQSMPLKVDVPGGTTRNGPGTLPDTGTSTSLYFPLEVDPTAWQAAGTGQSMALMDVVPATGWTCAPDATAPAVPARPPASQVDRPGHETALRVDIRPSRCGDPGIPAETLTGDAVPFAVSHGLAGRWRRTRDGVECLRAADRPRLPRHSVPHRHHHTLTGGGGRAHRFADHRGGTGDGAEHTDPGDGPRG